MMAWWHGGMVFLISGWAYVFFLNELVVVAWPSCGSMVDFIFLCFFIFIFLCVKVWYQMSDFRKFFLNDSQNSDFTNNPISIPIFK